MFTKIKRTLIKSTLAVVLATVALGGISTAEAAYRNESVGAHSSKFYTYHAYPGETFRAVVSGDGDTDVDLFVRNGYGSLICRSDSAGDDESCTVYSANGGRYTIEVRNLGSLYNVVQLWVN